ncbi:MAG: thioether cross-link-forming SCIFF peptide maturase [Oscillospiraceae bacterium]|nr:thioether cross-link-forming SCIFF peptide maturase [Oscillospiraceae bacterium]
MKESNLHKFSLAGNYFVIDPASGAVHIADKQAFDLLDKVKPSFFERYSGIDGGCYSELYNLYKDGLLFSEDSRYNYQSYAETAVDAPLKALCLHVSHDCNLKCEYCFADSFVNQAECCGESSQMSVETAKQAIELLVRESGERVVLEADFFGGEPLMAWETVTAAVDYARANESKWGKTFRFTITTNGLLLDDDKIAYINEQMSNCVLSLDGRKSVNDRVRPAHNGKGSFDLVIDKYKKLIQSRTKPGFTDCYVRGTFTAYNLDFSEDVIELARLGFENVSIEPVTAAADDLPYAIRREHLPQIYKQYERLFRLIKSRRLKVNFFHFNIDLKGGPCVIRRLRGCGCGNEYLAVAPSGRIYPCHRFAENDRWHMGGVSIGPHEIDIKKYFAKTHIYSKTDCPDCWARFYCSGGCNASSYEVYSDCRVTASDSVECLMMKKRLECAIALNALKLK